MTDRTLWLILYHYALPYRTFDRRGFPEGGYAPLFRYRRPRRWPPRILW
jgi:hypothetical protein